MTEENEKSRPEGRRTQRRPLKRLLDVWGQNRKTSGPNPCWLDDDDGDDDYANENKCIVFTSPRLISFAEVLNSMYERRYDYLAKQSVWYFPADSPFLHWECRCLGLSLVGTSRSRRHSMLHTSFSALNNTDIWPLEFVTYERH